MSDCLRLRSEDLHWRVIDGEVVILDARSEVYLALNRTGADLWRLLADGASRDDLVEQLVTAHAVDARRAGVDVDALLAELSARSLLAGGPGAGGT